MPEVVLSGAVRRKCVVGDRLNADDPSTLDARCPLDVSPVSRPRASHHQYTLVPHSLRPRLGMTVRSACSCLPMPHLLTSFSSP